MTRVSKKKPRNTTVQKQANNQLILEHDHLTTAKANDNAIHFTRVPMTELPVEIQALAAAVAGSRAAMRALDGTRGHRRIETQGAVADYHRVDALSSRPAATEQTRVDQACEVDSSVAATILEQLGGKDFMMMTGANNFAADGTTLAFRFPKAMHNINCLRVTLTPMDEYTMVFSRIRAGRETIVEEVSSVYCDSLQEIFTEITGLDTRIF